MVEAMIGPQNENVLFREDIEHLTPNATSILPRILIVTDTTIYRFRNTQMSYHIPIEELGAIVKSTIVNESVGQIASKECILVAPQGKDQHFKGLTDEKI